MAVRTAAPSEERLQNTVAVFRGAGMVVQYVDMEDVSKYGPDFHAVLACGQARTELGEEPSFVDRHVEQLLRAAEPAAHNEWTGTPRLKNEYTGRRVGTVQDLQRSLLRDELRALVAKSEDDSGERLESFEKLFPVSVSRGSSGGGGSPSTPGPVKRDLHELAFDDDHWEFEVTLEPSGGDEDWAARVWLTQLFESGSDGENLGIGDVVELEDSAEATCSIDEDGKVLVEATGPGEVKMRCSSVPTGAPDPRSGRTGRTGVRHEIVESEGSS